MLRGGTPRRSGPKCFDRPADFCCSRFGAPRRCGRNCFDRPANFCCSRFGTPRRCGRNCFDRPANFCCSRFGTPRHSGPNCFDRPANFCCSTFGFPTRRRLDSIRAQPFNRGRPPDPAVADQIIIHVLLSVKLPPAAHHVFRDESRIWGRFWVDQPSSPKKFPASLFDPQKNTIPVVAASNISEDQLQRARNLSFLGKVTAALAHPFLNVSYLDPVIALLLTSAKLSYCISLNLCI